MDEKPDLQKRPLCETDDKNLSCPDCKDLEEHRNKNCSKQLLTKTTDSSNRKDVDTEKKDDTEKRQCYKCEDCHLTFLSSECLEDHLKEKCLKIPVADPKAATASYEACMNTLRVVMYNEECYFNSLREARSETNAAVKRYSLAKKQKDSTQNAYTVAYAREQTLCIIVTAAEHGILYDLRAQHYQNLMDALLELENAGEAANHALHKLKKHNHIAMCGATRVHFAYSDALKAFRERRFDKRLKPKAEDQELIKIRDVLQQRDRILTELQDGVKELEISVELMLGIEPEEHGPPESGSGEVSAAGTSESGSGEVSAAGTSESEGGRVSAAETSESEGGRVSAAETSESGEISAARTSESKSGRDHTPNTMREAVRDSQATPMDVTVENLDDPRPPTSG